MRLIKLFALMICFSVFACSRTEKTDEVIHPNEVEKDSLITTGQPLEVPLEEEINKELQPPVDYDTTLWTDISRIQPDILLDLRYATINNFLETQLYECARCFLRPETAKALQKVHLELREQGYGLLVWDCYRPQSVQRKMWEVMPNPNYIANPDRGSMHSRGVAVDATIVDESGTPLDMGTDFDYFGRAAHYDNRDLPEEVLRNRDLLRTTMEKYGLMGIRTEWWHFSLRGVSFPLDEMVWGC